MFGGWGGGGAGGGGGGGGGGAATALVAQSRQRGHNELGPTEKKIMYSLIFCTDATYKISSSQLKLFSIIFKQQKA